MHDGNTNYTKFKGAQTTFESTIYQLEGTHHNKHTQKVGNNLVQFNVDSHGNFNLMSLRYYENDLRMLSSQGKWRN
jgi:hypothetical protein